MLFTCCREKRGLLLFLLFATLVLFGCGLFQGNKDLKEMVEPEIKGKIYVDVEAKDFGAVTIVQLKINDIEGIEGAKSFVLINEDEWGVKTSIEVCGYQYTQKNTLQLLILNEMKQVLAEATIKGEVFTGHVDLFSPREAWYSVQPQEIPWEQDYQEVLALSKLPLHYKGEVPLLTLSGQLGLFVMNDVGYDFHYAYADDEKFDQVLGETLKNHHYNLEKIDLFFRLPNTTSFIDAKTGEAVHDDEIIHTAKTVAELYYDPELFPYAEVEVDSNSEYRVTVYHIHHLQEANFFAVNELDQMIEIGQTLEGSTTADELVLYILQVDNRIIEVKAENGTIDVTFAFDFVKEPNIHDFAAQYRENHVLGNMDSPVHPDPSNGRNERKNRFLLQSYEDLPLTELTWDGAHTATLTFEPFEPKEVERSYLVRVNYLDGDYFDAEESFVVAALKTIVSIAEVDYIEVPFGTEEEEAIALLNHHTTITDSLDEEHIVELTWSIEDYDGETAGDYTATGTFELPPDVTQPHPPMDLQVEARVTVIQDLEQWRLKDLGPEGNLQDPENVYNIIDNRTFFGIWSVSYRHSRLPSALQEHEDYQLLINGESHPFTVNPIQPDIYEVHIHESYQIEEVRDSIFEKVSDPPDPHIVFIAAVEDTTVAYGTEKEEAVAALAEETTITDSDDHVHTVAFSWSIEDYDGETAEDYTATGTFELPPGVIQSHPPKDLLVIATVTVMEELDYLRLRDLGPEGSLEDPDNVYNIIDNRTFFGIWSVSYRHSRLPSAALQEHEDYQLLINGESHPFTVNPIHDDIYEVHIHESYQIQEVRDSMFEEVSEPPDPHIVFIAAVEDTTVAYGTEKEEAVAALAEETTITDSDDHVHTVAFSWSIEDYDGETAGDYTAIGTFELPPGVIQSYPPKDLQVEATVTVMQEYWKLRDLGPEGSLQEPDNVYNIIDNRTLIGVWSVSYRHSRLPSVLQEHEEYQLLINGVSHPFTVNPIHDDIYEVDIDESYQIEEVRDSIFEEK